MFTVCRLASELTGANESIDVAYVKHIFTAATSLWRDPILRRLSGLVESGLWARLQGTSQVASQPGSDASIHSQSDTLVSGCVIRKSSRSK